MEEKEKIGIPTELEDKGKKWEFFVAKKLMKLGWNVVAPQKQNGEYNKYSEWDFAIEKDDKTIYVQVKGKDRREHYPDTGMNLKQFKTYLEFQKEHNISFLILFVEPTTEKIYGDFIDNLNGKENNISTWNKQDGYEMIYWNLNILKDYRELLEVYISQ